MNLSMKGSVMLAQFVAGLVQVAFAVLLLNMKRQDLASGLAAVLFVVVPLWPVAWPVGYMLNRFAAM